VDVAANVGNVEVVQVAVAVEVRAHGSARPQVGQVNVPRFSSPP
jgi:hypothetical protein